MDATESALIVTVPEAEPAVGPHRARLDSGAIVGVPAHVTVLYPFMPPDLISDDILADLECLFGAAPPFDVTFASVAWFNTAVAYLRPTPDQRLRDLTTLVLARWPEYPPYGGSVSDPVPHLTIGDNGDVAALTDAADAIEPSLPITTRVDTVHLFVGSFEPSSYRHRAAFRLGPPTPS